MLADMSNINAVSDLESLENVLSGDMEDMQCVSVTAGLLKDLVQELDSLRADARSSRYQDKSHLYNTEYGL